jgi:hypothetical protein
LPKPNENKTIPSSDDFDLTKLLLILGANTRMKILELLRYGAIDAREILMKLGSREIFCSRENVKNHLDKLLEIGFIRRQRGVRDGKPVWQYVFVPGAVEAAIQTLNQALGMNLQFEKALQMEELAIKHDPKLFFLKIKEAQKRLIELCKKYASLRVLGGLDDGRIFFLKKDEIRLGRVDYANPDGFDSEEDVVLSNSYETVSRASMPHAKIVHRADKWYVEHCNGLNGTYLLREKAVEKDVGTVGSPGEQLYDGDIIILAKRSKGVMLVFRLPK